MPESFCSAQHINLGVIVWLFSVDQLKFRIYGVLHLFGDGRSNFACQKALKTLQWSATVLRLKLLQSTRNSTVHRNLTVLRNSAGPVSLPSPTVLSKSSFLLYALQGLEDTIFIVPYVVWTCIPPSILSSKPSTNVKYWQALLWLLYVEFLYLRPLGVGHMIYVLDYTVYRGKSHPGKPRCNLWLSLKMTNPPYRCFLSISYCASRKLFQAIIHDIGLILHYIMSWCILLPQAVIVSYVLTGPTVFLDNIYTVWRWMSCSIYSRRSRWQVMHLVP